MGKSIRQMWVKSDLWVKSDNKSDARWKKWPLKDNILEVLSRRCFFHILNKSENARNTFVQFLYILNKKRKKLYSYFS